MYVINDENAELLPGKYLFRVVINDISSEKLSELDKTLRNIARTLWESISTLIVSDLQINKRYPISPGAPNEFYAQLLVGKSGGKTVIEVIRKIKKAFQILGTPEVKEVQFSAPVAAKTPLEGFLAGVKEFVEEYWPAIAIVGFFLLLAVLSKGEQEK